MTHQLEVWDTPALYWINFYGDVYRNFYDRDSPDISKFEVEFDHFYDEELAKWGAKNLGPRHIEFESREAAMTFVLTWS